MLDFRGGGIVLIGAIKRQFGNVNLVLVAVLVCLTFVDVNAQAQSQVKVSASSPGEVRVEAELSSPARSWSFRNAYAGILGIAERVESFRAIVASGQDLSVKKVATGEFRTDSDASRIVYTVKLSTPRTADVSHISWLVADRGFLMFADLMPQDIESISAEFILPTGWTIESSIGRDSAGRYDVLEPSQAVFFVGPSLRKTTHNVDGLMYEIVVSGKWPFKDSQAEKAATQVMRKYLAMIGYRLPGKSVIMIASPPMPLPTWKWKAETRGLTVVLLLDPKEIELWYEQLVIIFSHEVLHLWVPNSLKLQGDYDWFFEGFTMYVALGTALELKAINFKGFLATLAGAYDAYLSHLDADSLSLVEASERRWTSSFSTIYVKGMLVAFLYDLITRKESGGKTSLADRYRELFGGRVTDDGNANEAIIALLGSSQSTRDLAKAYIENSTKLELERVLPAYGLLLDSSGKSSKLRVSPGLNADQKQLLRGLGYRN